MGYPLLIDGSIYRIPIRAGSEGGSEEEGWPNVALVSPNEQGRIFPCTPFVHPMNGIG